MRIIIALVLIILLCVPGAAAKPPPKEEQCPNEKHGIEVGFNARPRCRAHERTWICVGSAGVHLWARNGLFLLVRPDRCTPRP